jgi:large repetitive protein
MNWRLKRFHLFILYPKRVKNRYCMKDTHTIADKEPKFAPIHISITNQNFYSILPMNRPTTFWRLTASLIVVLLSLTTSPIWAKNSPIRGISTPILQDISLFIAKPSARVGDLVAVEVTTDGFTNVEDFIIPISWNPTLLSFQSVSNLSTDVPNFSATNFNTTNVATGALLANWTNTGTNASIVSGERFFTINFRVLTYSGTPAAVIFNDLAGITIHTLGNTAATIARNNGHVTIIDINPCPPRPAGLTCQTAPILNATEFPYYNTLPTDNRLTVPTLGTPCVMPIENNNWLSFIAASTELSLKLKATNCTGGPLGNGNGLQFAVYETSDCNTFQKLLCSQSGPIPDTENIFDLMGLTIGKQYYLMIDGSRNDVCTFTLSIASGQVYNSTQAIPAQTVAGQSVICGNRIGLTYSIPTVPNADAYFWRLPSSATPTTPISGATQTSITVNWGNVSDSVCVRIASRCDTTKWFCKSVKMGTPATTNLDISKCPQAPYFFKGENRYAAGTYIDTLRSATGCDSIVTLLLRNYLASTRDTTVTKCAQDAFSFGGSARRAEGDYSVTFSTAAGCDSTVILHLFNYPVASKNVDTTICAGTSVVIGGQTRSTNGSYTITVPRGSSRGCDSIISLKLTVIDFLLQTPTKNNDITCETPQSTLTAVVINPPTNGQVAYEWKNPSGTVIGATSAVSVNQAGIYTLKVTVTLNGISCSKTTTVTVIKSGNQPAKPTIAGQNQSCEVRNEVFIVPTPAANVTNYNWTVSNGTFTTQTNQITTTWNANATASKVCVNAQNACGVSDTACISVEIGRVPGPLSITGSTTVCPNATITYRVTATSNTTLTWELTGGIAQNALNLDSLWVTWAAINGRVTVTPSNRCGTGTPTNLDVQISNTLPDSVPIQGIATPCSNDTTTYTVANSINTLEYLWQVPAGATILTGQGTRTITVVWGSFSGNGDVFLTTKNVCKLARGVAFPVTVKNSTLASPTIIGSRTVCPSTQISFSTPRDVNIRSYTWTVPTDAIILRGAGTDSIRVDWNISPSGQVCLDVENTCGVRKRTCINVEVRADLDSLVITGGTMVCKDSTLRFCVPDDGSALRFLWQIPSITGGTIVSGQGTSCINIRFASTGGTVRVVPVGGCSDGKLSRRDVIVKSPPAIVGTISGKSTVCNNSITTYTIASQTDVTRYLWSLPTGVSFIGDSINNTITVNISSTATSGFLTVRPENGCGLGNGTTLRVTIVQRPLVYAGADTAVCGKTMLLNGSSNGTLKTWSVVTKPSGASANFAFPDRSQTSITVSKSGTYIFRFEEANGGDCNMADSITVIFRDLPIVTVVDQNCNQEATEYRVQLSVVGNGSPFSLGGSVLGAFQGANFLSNVIPSGTPYFFIVTDAFGCKSDTLRGTKQCPCYTAAGTLKADSLVVCYGTSGKATPLGDAKLDGNDTFEYVLHTGTATRIGNIFMRNRTGIFNFDPAFLLYNRVYYITFIVGDQQTNGSVDTSKRCASQSRGIPIIFKDKFTAGLTGDTTVCRFSPIRLHFKTNNTGFLDITYRADSGSLVAVPNLRNNTDINVNPSLSATYKLVDVADKNGCKAQITDSARVNLRTFPIANAGIDRSICTNQVQLNASENFAYKGRWTSLTSGIRIVDSSNARTVVDRLQNGINVFIWTVQDTACLDYSVRDTVQIFLPLLPKAVNLSLITRVRVPVNGNVTESAPLGTYSVTRLTNPTSGRFDLFSNGSFTYIPDSSFIGIVKFKYIICSDSCTRLCDTGEVRILIQPSTDSVKIIKINVPNAITPNDDGKNDVLVIDGLDEFGENELVIFNRWGDVLYKSKPYKNEWRGTNQSGDPLPEGTYYYILRLNTADGKVLRGDMTILR